MNRIERRLEKKQVAAYSREVTKAFRRGRCHHPSAPDDCVPRFIQAHTVSRSHLAFVAERGHVISFLGKSAMEVHRRGGRIPAASVGINKASSFPLFCGLHDNDLFSILEDHAFVASRTQLVRLVFRAHAREVFLKQRTLEVCMGSSFRMAPRFEEFIRSTNVSLQGLRRRLDAAGLAILSGDPGGWRSIVVEYGGDVDFVCCGAYSPFVDFAGKDVQPLGDQRHDIEGVVFSVLPNREGPTTLAVLSWSIRDHLAERFAQSFAATGAPFDLVLQFAIKAMENVYLRPSFWASLSPGTQRRLTDAANAGVFDPVYSDELVHEIGLGIPTKPQLSMRTEG